ncbi:MAG: glucose-6-phosphate dehydrogenase [Chloroflexi bacterium]|nr:glucose-6-phosphate dehydrogenase [Chloroflexota bacterium]
MTQARTTPSVEEQAINPLREGLRLERTAPPCAMVIFGGGGDLAKRKLMPALYQLALNRLLPAEFTVLGFARSPLSDEEFRRTMRAAVGEFSRTQPLREPVWDSFSQGLFYLSGNLDDPQAYQRIAARLDELDRTRGTCGNRLFYLATPPSAFPVIVQRLGEAGLTQGPQPQSWVRIVIEKPFGRDLKTAIELNHTVRSVFQERQVYRIDHYLGKETVQNLLAFRFSNGLWEPVWNRQYIDHVQITVAESVGIENRASYYEEAGALRDMVQSHMFQLLALVAMEPPVSFEADTVRDEKVKVLRAIRPIPEDRFHDFTVRGQYGAGWIGGREAPAYRDEPGVARDSPRETYAALKLFIDNWRWADTPFYLRHGKRLPKRVTEVAIQFKRAPHLLFAESGGEQLEPNLLLVRIQPDEGISLRFAAKVPGPTMHLRSVHMDFLYGSAFLVDAPDAYERLLLDCMLGDATLFTRNDEAEQAWAYVTRLLEGWERATPDFPNYEAGAWGPEEADRFLERDGRRWRVP